jgi:hypothetical protein
MARSLLPRISLAPDRISDAVIYKVRPVNRIYHLKTSILLAEKA